MKCPFCSNPKTKVVDSRVNDRKVRRRRECLNCKERFTTYEKPDIDLKVEKRDGQKEKFKREKIRAGIEQACNKRPVTEEQIEQITEEIEQKIRNKEGNKVDTSLIGELVMEKLKEIDKVSYVRFASVCKQFEDTRSFKKELKDLKE